MIADDYDLIRDRMKELGVGGGDPFAKANAPKSTVTPVKRAQELTFGECDYCRRNEVSCDGGCAEWFDGS